MAQTLRDSSDSSKEMTQLGSAGAAHTVVGTLTPLGYQQITSLAAAATLTVPTGARIAHIQPQTQAIRWRDDGTAPTASVGMNLAVGSTLEYVGNLAAIKLIEVTASAAVNVTYYS